MNNVQAMIFLCNNPAHYDDYVGWTDDLNAINQNKNYVSTNARFFESNAKKDIYNCGHMLSISMLYYIEQDPDFESWYVPHTRNSYHTGY